MSFADFGDLEPEEDLSVPDWLARFLRTLVQLAAAGTFTVLFEQIAQDVPAYMTPYILIISMLVVTFSQNAAEQAGWIPTILKPENAAEERA